MTKQTPGHGVDEVIEYADTAMTPRTSTVNFRGLSLTVKELSSEIFGCSPSQAERCPGQHSVKASRFPGQR